MRRLSLALSAGLSLVAAAAGAHAASSALTVNAGQAASVSLGGAVRDVVVGDPNIADVSVINERTLVVLGKKAGATTLLAFDARGQALADRQVVVSAVPTEAVTVQRGASAAVYACSDRCSALPVEDEKK